MAAVLYIHNSPATILHLAVVRRLITFLLIQIQLKTEYWRIGAKVVALDATCVGGGEKK